MEDTTKKVGIVLGGGGLGRAVTAASVAVGMAQAEAGDTHDLGSFAQYAVKGGTITPSIPVLAVGDEFDFGNGPQKVRFVKTTDTGYTIYEFERAGKFKTPLQTVSHNYVTKVKRGEVRRYPNAAGLAIAAGWGG